jgi:hypothetical protein
VFAGVFPKGEQQRFLSSAFNPDPDLRAAGKLGKIYRIATGVVAHPLAALGMPRFPNPLVVNE